MAYRSAVDTTWMQMDLKPPTEIYTHVRTCRRPMCFARFTVGLHNFGQRYCADCGPVAEAERIARSVAKAKERRAKKRRVCP